MGKMVNGYSDIHTILMNERKVGGIIEANRIKLRTGEEYLSAVITNIDFCGSVFYSLGFIDQNGDRMMVHVHDISIIDNPTHKRVHQCTNEYYKKLRVEEKIQYLNRLCEVNEGCYTEIFLNEVRMIIEDIGIESIKNKVDLSFLHEQKRKIYRIA